MYNNEKVLAKKTSTTKNVALGSVTIKKSNSSLNTACYTKRNKLFNDKG